MIFVVILLYKLCRNEIRKTKAEIVRLLAKHTGHTEEEVDRDMARPKYFTPQEAIEYGIIDNIMSTDEAKARRIITTPELRL